MIAGGSGLLLLGFIQRATKDVDVLGLSTDDQIRSANPLPHDLVEAVRDVGAALGLAPDWLNAGPTDLLESGLPSGFVERLSVRTFGSLTVHLASRFDQVCFKLYATVDQGPRSKHADDLRQLVPSTEELLEAARWTMTHDGSDAFRAELLGALRFFGVEAPDDALF